MLPQLFFSVMLICSIASCQFAEAARKKRQVVDIAVL